MTTVLLLRHGRTTANTGGVLAGWTPGVQLDETGAQQVRAVGERLAKVPLAAVVSSPLERCQQSAAAVLDGRDLSVQTDDRLGEARYGDWTGRTIKELVKEPLWKVVQQHPSAAVFPGPEGEGLAQTQARAVAAVRGLERHARPRRGVAGLQPRRRHQGDPRRRPRPAPRPVPADRRRPGVDLGGHLHRHPALRRPGQRHRRRRLGPDPAAEEAAARQGLLGRRRRRGGAGPTV